MNEADVIWSVDGGDGRRGILAGLVLKHLDSLDSLLPEEFDDPMEQLAAELGNRPDEALAADPQLARLFPPILDDAQEAEQFRADAVVQQARARVAAARTVLADLAVAEEGEPEVMVPVAHMDAWVRTLSAIRTQWHVELTGNGERMAEATERDHRRNPTASAVCDWLAYLVEDALETLSVAKGEL